MPISDLIARPARILCVRAGARPVRLRRRSAAILAAGFYRSMAQAGAELDTAVAASMISGYRQNNGLGAVTVDPELTKLAEAQARAMVAKDKLDHNVGGSFKDRLKRSGYNARTAVENISAGYHTLAEAFSGWRDSPPHKANMLNRRRDPDGDRRGLCAELQIQGVLGPDHGEPGYAELKAGFTGAVRRNRFRPPGTMLPQIKNYDELYRQFRWQIPPDYNIGVDVCDRWAALDARRIAIVHVHPDGRHDDITFGWLKDTSNRLANVLRAHGVKRGDRVAILLAADAGSRRRACRDLQARRGRAADRVPVRAGRDLLSPAEFRRGGADHQCAGSGEARRDPQRRSGLEMRDLDRRRGRRRARFQRGDREGVVRFHAGADHARYAGDDDLHLGHHGPAERRAARPSRAARASAGRGNAA